MEIRDDIDAIAKKYKLKEYVFIGCDGECHYVKFFGNKTSLLRMLTQIRKNIIEYFLTRG